MVLVYGYSWSVRQGYLQTNPVATLEIPSGEHSEIVFSPAEVEKLLSCVRNDSLKDLIITTWETGCRPQESLRVEARHVDLKNRRWVIPKSESKTKRLTRVVYLNERAFEITERLVEENPIGALPSLSPTKKVKGEVIKKTDWKLRMEAKRKLTISLCMGLAPRYSLYALRHSWATQALLKGIDPLTVAILMGHEDPSMLSKVYQHLSLNPKHMLAEAERATGADE